MERPIFKPIGTPEVELDTPAFVVDVEKLDRNIETAASFFRDSGAGLRPHVSGHGSPAIAHRQLAAGGTVEGIATATVGQAEVFARYGFGDIFVANVIATPLKATRLSALARTATVTAAADSTAAVGVLSEAASAASVTLNVVVYVPHASERHGRGAGRRGRTGAGSGWGRGARLRGADDVRRRDSSRQPGRARGGVAQVGWGHGGREGGGRSGGTKRGCAQYRGHSQL